MISVRDLGFSYEGERAPAFERVSATVEAGDLWTVYGPNGTGKSTLLRVLGGLAPRVYPGTVAGEGAVLGVELGGRAHGLAERVGYLTDNPWAHASGVSRSVEGELALALENRGLARDGAVQKARRVLERVGLLPLADRSPATLSGGESQALGIAAALVGEPPLLLFDQPDLHLDRDKVAAVRSLVAEERARGTAVVWATVDPDGAPPQPTLTWSAHGREEPEVVLPPLPFGPPRDRSGAVLAAFEDVSFSYREGAPVLDRFHLSIEGGSVTALSGPNGSGKTTAARLLLGLLEPDSGRVTLSGRPVSARRVSENARNVGLVFQNPSAQLFRRSVREELADGFSRSAHGVPGRKEAAIEGIATALGVAPFLDESPYDLPWSARRLVALGSILSLRPDTLVLDEPTAGLDSREREAVSRIVRSWADRGGAVLLITHDADWADARADVHRRMPAREEARP